MPCELPKNLIKDLSQQKVAIVLGAGVSKNSLGADGITRPPLWSEFLEAGLNQIRGQRVSHIRKAIKTGDFLHACEWIKSKLDDDWIEFLRSQFIEPNYQPNELHDEIFRLDQRIVLSLNIDNIFETFVQQQTGGMTTVKRFSDPDVSKFLREHSEYIIKPHGSIESPHEIIFTQKEYAEARTNYSLFYRALDACILSHTLLFIGCGTSDPDFTLLLENQNFRFPNSQPHYMITSSNMNSDLENSLRQNRNIKCIKYKAANNHSELLEIVKEINLQIESQNALGQGV